MNCASKSVISLSCQINLGETSSVRESCTKDRTCLRDLIRLSRSTTLLIHWDIHGSTVFIQVLGEALDVSTFSGRIILFLGDSAEFGLSTLSGRIVVGTEDDSVRCFVLFKIVMIGHSNSIDSILLVDEVSVMLSMGRILYLL